MLGWEANLASLGLDQVPVVNLRRHPGVDVPFEDQVAAMVALREEGLIGAIGLSTVTLDEYRQARALAAVACVQNAYSVADRSDQAVFDACRDDDVAYVPYFPLGSAFMPDKPVLQHPAVQQAAERLGRHGGAGGPGLAPRTWRRTCCSSPARRRWSTWRRTWRRPRWCSTTRRWRRWAETFQQGKPKRKDDGIGSLQSAPVVERDDRRSADCRGQLWRRLLVGARELEGLATGSKLTRDGRSDASRCR